MRNFSIILAVDNENGIGKDNSLVWNLPNDLKRFKEVTTITSDLGKMNAVIMGRKTWESIPAKYKPLPNRINCIISKSLKSESKDSAIDDFVLYFNSLEHTLEELSKKENIENIFIIGGASIYNEALKNKFIEKIYLTEIDGIFNCDTFVELDLENFDIEEKGIIQEENGLKYRFMTYKKSTD